MIHLDWDAVALLAKCCEEKLREDGFVPDYVLGITMGGLVPAAIIAEQFETRNFATISAESYHNKAQGELNITFLPNIDFAEKKVLLVDEIADSGATLKKIVEILREKYAPAELKTATLIVNSENCIFRPDVFAREVTEWVHFPWERN